MANSKSGAKKNMREGMARNSPEEIRKMEEESMKKLEALNRSMEKKASETGDDFEELDDADIEIVNDPNVIEALNKKEKEISDYRNRIESIADQKDEERGQILGKMAEQSGPAEAEDLKLRIETPEQEQKRLFQEKRDGIIAGKEAFDRKQAQQERDRLAIKEMAAQHENRAVSGKTISAREAEQAGDFIANAALKNDLSGRSEMKEMISVEYLGNERKEAADFLESLGLSDVDAYAVKLVTSRWEQVKHAAKMLKPSFRRAWNAFISADQKYQSALKEEQFSNMPEINSSSRGRAADRTSRNRRSGGPTGGSMGSFKS